jgi:hypothetical protein
MFILPVSNFSLQEKRVRKIREKKRENIFFMSQV